MPIIKPISDLKNYNEVLQDVATNEPVFLTKNGRGKYAILDIDDYQKIQATIKLLTKFNEAESVAKDFGWLTSEDVAKELEV